MPTEQTPKKSESIEIRLAYETKLAFMARCRQEGRTASEALRLMIAHQLATPKSLRRRPTMRWRMIGAAAAGLMLGAGAAPSLARVTQDRHAAFDRIDRNHDGVLNYDEFRAL